MGSNQKERRRDDEDPDIRDYYTCPKLSIGKLLQRRWNNKYIRNKKVKIKFSFLVLEQKVNMLLHLDEFVGNFRLFERIDVDKDNFVSRSELKQLIMEINSQKIPEDVDEATAKIMKELDTSGDQQIDEDEFIKGFKDWLNTSNYEIVPKSPGTKTDKPWERWMDDGVDRSGWAWIKAIMRLVLGIVMLAVMAEPLIHSVQNVSNAANIPSFFISFILVPLATNARAAISAIKTASQKNERTTSLTFSELYDGVFMNNVLGFFVLLAVIYFRGLTWEFSYEVLVVLIVCIIMGTAASFRSKYPIWTSFTAYLLYPSSLIFVYLLNKF